MNSNGSGDDIHLVPVPKDRLQEVYAVLGRPKGEGGLPGSPPPSGQSPGGGGGSVVGEELILRAYRESPPSMVKFLGYLADHPDEIVSSGKLAEELEITWNQLAGVLGAFGRRWKNRYQQKGPWFFESHWNFDENHQDYKMPAEVADIIKGARSGG